MVLMAMSPNPSRISRQRASGMPPSRWRCAQRGHHPLAHFGGGLAREGDRQDVARRHAGFEQRDVAIDEHARLAGARRGFERDVAPRIDREAPRPLIRRLLRLSGDIEVQPWLIKHC